MGDEGTGLNLIGNENVHEDGALRNRYPLQHFFTFLLSRAPLLHNAASRGEGQCRTPPSPLHSYFAFILVHIHQLPVLHASEFHSHPIVHLC
jgi:hypothetical protein